MNVVDQKAQSDAQLASRERSLTPVIPMLLTSLTIPRELVHGSWDVQLAKVLAVCEGISSFAVWTLITSARTR
jgi:hypothetical protein